MKITFLTMAAIAALSAATPAAAQSWHGKTTQSAALQAQIDDGVRGGTISRADMPALRDSLRQLAALERQFSPGGISRREGAILDQRSTDLTQQIMMAERSGGYDRLAKDNDGRGAWEARYDRDHRAAWESRYLSERSAQYEDGFGRNVTSGSNDRFDRPNHGDRFAGDVRVGQRFSTRMGPMPAEYRIEYRDNDQVYYGYDDQRIYRVDRRTGLILGLLDISN